VERERWLVEKTQLQQAASRNGWGKVQDRCSASFRGNGQNNTGRGCQNVDLAPGQKKTDGSPSPENELAQEKNWGSKKRRLTWATMSKKTGECQGEGVRTEQKVQWDRDRDKEIGGGRDEQQNPNVGKGHKGGKNKTQKAEKTCHRRAGGKKSPRGYQGNSIELIFRKRKRCWWKGVL